MESHLAAQDSSLVSQFVHKLGPVEAVRLRLEAASGGGAAAQATAQAAAPVLLNQLATPRMTKCRPVQTGESRRSRAWLSKILF